MAWQKIIIIMALPFVRLRHSPSSPPLSSDLEDQSWKYALQVFLSNRAEYWQWLLHRPLESALNLLENGELAPSKGSHMSRENGSKTLDRLLKRRGTRDMLTVNIRLQRQMILSILRRDANVGPLKNVGVFTVRSMSEIWSFVSLGDSLGIRWRLNRCLNTPDITSKLPPWYFKNPIWLIV